MSAVVPWRDFFSLSRIFQVIVGVSQNKTPRVEASKGFVRLASKRPRIINIHIAIDKYKTQTYIFASFIGLDRCNASIAAPIGAATDPLDFFLTIRQP